MEFTPLHSAGLHRWVKRDCELIIDCFDFIPKNGEAMEIHNRTITFLRKVGDAVIDPIFQKTESGYKTIWKKNFPIETTLEEMVGWVNENAKIEDNQCQKLRKSTEHLQGLQSAADEAWPSFKA